MKKSLRYVEISPLKRDYYRGAPIAFWNANCIGSGTYERKIDRLSFYLD